MTSDRAPSLFDGPGEEWTGMPEFVQEDREPIQKIVVNFATRDDVDAFAVIVGYALTPRSRSIWFPFKHRTNAAAFEYRDAREPDDIPR